MASIRPHPNVVILAAGRGSRLGPATADIPKSLLEVGGRTVLDRQLAALERCGVPDSAIAIVTGFASDRLHDRLGDRCRFIHNPHFAEYNNIYSVHLIDQNVTDDMLLINGDTLFHPDVLEALIECDQDASLVIDQTIDLGDEQMKTIYENGRLSRIGKDLDAAASTGEYIGLLRFRGLALRAYFDDVANMIEAGLTDQWYEAAIGRTAQRLAIGLTPTSGRPWIEIDTPEDVARAERIVGQLDA